MLLFSEDSPHFDAVASSCFKIVFYCWPSDGAIELSNRQSPSFCIIQGSPRSPTFKSIGSAQTTKTRIKRAARLPISNLIPCSVRKIWIEHHVCKGSSSPSNLFLCQTYLVECCNPILRKRRRHRRRYCVYGLPPANCHRSRYSACFRCCLSQAPWQLHDWLSLVLDLNLHLFTLSDHHIFYSYQVPSSEVSPFSAVLLQCAEPPPTWIFRAIMKDESSGHRTSDEGRKKCPFQTGQVEFHTS